MAIVALVSVAAYCDRPLAPPLGGDSLGESACASPINECVKGTVDYTQLEGGCWLIKADNGKTYQPVGGLDEQYQKDGLRVFVVFRRADNMAGFCPGQIVNLVSLTVLPGGTISPVTPVPPVNP